LKRHTIVGIGEILWDVFPDCSRLGVAPANFACSAAGLGRERVSVHMVSSVGTDDLGTRAVAALGHRSVGTSYVVSQDKPTGQVRVELDEMGRANYEFVSDTARDNLIWSDDLAELARRTDACCFGTLVGAGDASTAALSLGLLDRSNLQEINEAACSAAAFVCSQSGATPQMSPLNDDSGCMKT